MDDDRVEVRQQADLVVRWVNSAQARRFAASLVGRYRLDCDADDLVQQAWVRVSTSFAARQAPLESLNDDVSAARYGHRLLSNLAIDYARSQARRTQIGYEVDRIVDGPETDAVAVVYFEAMLVRLADTAVRDGNCGGCSAAVVRSIAIRAVQVIAGAARHATTMPGDDWFDRIIDEALDRVSGVGASERSRKRKSRCKSCVRDLIERVMGEMEGRRG